MRKLLITILTSLFVLTTQAATKASRDLATYLKAMQEQQSVHPDSLYGSILRLEKRKNASTDATERAITNAVLGYLYQQNAYTSSGRKYQSESDTTDMHSWSSDDYFMTAAKRYSEALRDLNLLHTARIQQWLPIVDKGEDDAIYDKDMLMVVWRAAQGLSRNYRKGIPTRQQLINYYKQQQNREAVLMLTLDTIAQAKQAKEELLRLKTEYQDLSLCADVYLKLAELESQDSAKAVWLKEGIQRYPKYKCRSVLEQALQTAEAPFCHWSMSTNRPYPGQIYQWIFNSKNTNKIEVKTSQPFSTTILPQREWDSHDTISWMAPTPGRYTLILQPSTTKKLEKAVTPDTTYINVTRLFAHTIALPNDKTQIIVNDAMTGQPVEGAQIRLYKVQKNKEKNDTIILEEGMTDQEGRYLVTHQKNNGRYAYNTRLHIEKGDDRYLEDNYLGYYPYYYNATDDQQKTVHIYTDRSIYRPGQVVHVGGLVSNRHQWIENTVEDDAYTLILTNPNGKEVARQKVTSDALGVFSADFTLPESGLTGNYRISVELDKVTSHSAARQSQSIRVEEYKRPTFDITTDPAPALQLPADSITLTGKAMTYSGVPVRSARVTGTYSWNEGYWYWWRNKSAGSSSRLDTVMTDAEGKFKVTIPIQEKTRKDLRHGQVLTVNYDITSTTGESHTARQSVFLSSKAISLYTKVPELNDKDTLQDWSLLLVSSTGTEVEGDVCLQFKQDNAVKYETTVKSGSRITPTFVKDIPSGKYLLEMQSISKGDTANYQTRVTIFSQEDTRLVVDTTLWVYVPESKFSTKKSARIQIGSHRNAYIYYTLMSAKRVIDNRLLHLNDSLITLDIPYKSEYGQGLTASIAMVYGNQTYRQTSSIRLEQPDKQLQHKWVTFRDRLQPGQKETWRLQLNRPDGTPASANLMATLYDASLDAIYSHHWSISHNLQYHFYNSTYWPTLNQHWMRHSSTFLLPDITTQSWSFSSFKSELFEQLPYGYVSGKQFHKMGRTNSFASTTSNDVMLMSAAAPNTSLKEVRIRGTEKMSNSQSDNAIMERRIAGLTQEDATEDASNEEHLPLEGGREGAVRQNFNETAAFFPALRTDKKGVVTLSFTLPESLTTWRLLGLAHTQDMLTDLLDEKVVTQKDLMAQLSLPRFLRQGDKAVIPATIYNVSGTTQRGRGVLTILDAATEKAVKTVSVKFDLAANRDTTFYLPYDVPEDADMLICRWTAEGSTCSDGEQHYLPVLTSKEWITDTKALTYTKAGTYTEDIAKMYPASSTNRSLTVEYVSQPVWYAIEALPSLAWPKSTDILSLTTAYYAGCLADKIASDNPNIEKAITTWKDKGLLQKSKLLQNEDVKNVIAEETPWINEAEEETQRISRLSTLFDEATQSSLQKEYLDKIRSLQNSDGSFSWFPGMKGSNYLTREVAYLLVRLRNLTGNAPESILSKAINYIRQDHPTTLCTSSLRYLYIIYNNKEQMDKADRHNADSLVKVLVKHPENLDLEDRALAAIILHKVGKERDAQHYLASVKHFLVTDKEGLTYFEFPQGSFTSINRKLHIHVQAMEALMEVQSTKHKAQSTGENSKVTVAEDSLLLDGMRRYLLRQKRTTEWRTPVNTANAVYALLLDNGQALQEGCDATLTLERTNGSAVVLGCTTNASRTDTQSASSSATFGYIRERIDGDTPVESLLIRKSGNQESWGGIYAQYLAPASDISASGTELRIEQTLSRGSAKVGDRLHIRYTIRADRDYEYVVLHAARPAACEPVNQLSSYRWQNGLGYYRAVKDASIEYYFDRLPRGTYVIEEDVFVDRAGEYSSGITKLQCLYAPEFSAHTRETKLKIEN